jgi:hypothetical protein
MRSFHHSTRASFDTVDVLHVPVGRRTPWRKVICCLCAFSMAVSAGALADDGKTKLDHSDWDAIFQVPEPLVRVNHSASCVDSNCLPGMPTEPSATTPTPRTTTQFGNGFQGGTLMASSTVPAMIGDFFGTGQTQLVDGPTTVIVPGGSLADAPGSTVGRMKLGENTSPLPRDRVFINYSYFDNTPLFPGGVDVHRVTPGFEKTFLNGNMSFELRTPFASTLDSTIIPDGTTSTSHTEFGNLTMYLKALLWQNEQLAFSTGLGIAVPTADNANNRDADGTMLMQVKNQSVHLLPFLGAVYAPDERLFVQGILQFDVDANGNPVSVTSFDGTNNPTGNMTRIGRPRDRTYMFFDISLGYWIYLNPDGGRLINGIAPIVEYHWNQTLDRGDAVRGEVNGDDWDFSKPGHLSVHNAVLGMTALVCDDATLTLAYVTPLHGSRRQFDGEFRLMFNWLFGASRPTTRLTRASVF